MRRVADQESSAASKVLGHTMVNLVSRKPIDPIHLQLQMLEGVLADVAPTKLVVMLFRFEPDGADDPRDVVPLHGKDGEKVGVVESNVQLVVREPAAKIDIGHVEDPLVGASRKADVEHLAHLGASPIAAGKVESFAFFFYAARSLQTSDHVIALLLEADELSEALDLDPLPTKVLDQKLFVLILGEDQQVREGAQSLAYVAEVGTSCRLAAHPDVDGRELEAAVDDLVRKTDLAIELERTRVHRERARRGPRLGRLVDDPDVGAHALEPERQDQAGRAGADDENLRRASRHRRHAANFTLSSEVRMGFDHPMGPPPPQPQPDQEGRPKVRQRCNSDTLPARLAGVLS